MKLKTRVLAQTLCAFLAFTLVLSVILLVSVAGIRDSVLAISGGLGNSAANISADSLEDQLIGMIVHIAQDLALILDERLIRIENHTRTTADIAGAIYTHKEAYRPHQLPYVAPGEITPPEPYYHAAPGVDLRRIRDEASLAGNIADMLRQIVVIDRGIISSTIGGESGYIIAMDAVPSPSADFDPRLYSWYRGAMEKGGLYWTEVYLDPRDRGPAVSCSMPYYDSSTGEKIFKGVARSTVILSDFSRIIDFAGARGQIDHMFLLDQSGLKLLSSDGIEAAAGADGSIEGENFLESADNRMRSLGMSMTLGAVGITELTFDGIPSFVAYAPIQTLGWSLGVVVPIREISAPALLIEERIQNLTGEAITGMNRRIFRFAGIIAVMVAAGLLAITVYSVRFTSSITGPILALNEGVREVSGGNLDREVSIRTGDELEQLAASFNAMTSRLREQISEIARATAEKERISAELTIATKIQASMLPKLFPPFKDRKNDFELYAAVYPAKEVGGDFYDFFFIDNDHFAIIIADVSGKGIPAALFMAVSMTLIENNLQNGERPDLALENINRQLCGDNTQNMFVTVWLGVLEISSGRLNFINAGHNPPLLRREGKGFETLRTPPDLVLAGMEDTLYHYREIRLDDGDTLFLYTDGITEAEDAQGNFYGGGRLLAFMDAHADFLPRRLLPALRADIEQFSCGAEQSDDITMLVFRFDREKGIHTITLNADTTELGTLISFIGRVLDKGACPEKIKGRIELAAEEVFVNIAGYSYKDKTGKVTIGCEIERNEGRNTMTLTFTDYGEPFNPLDIKEPDLSLPLEEREVGGLGVLIVKRTMDTINYKYENGMNRLLIRKSW
ncbi:MAG: SpoIIE family protein phosphatase [Treponema sp.]|jgi:sigma-B regulation protein RsbU (phosphoserine phosphatase)|nr:SpoIIE family protein phosphatase [Treponema sp.]